MNQHADTGRLHAIFMQAPAAMAVLSGPELRHSFANISYGNLLGQPADELGGRSLQECWPEPAAATLAALCEAALLSGETHRAAGLPLRPQEPGASVAVYDLTIQPIRNEQGAVTDVLLQVSGRDQAGTGQQLQQSEEQLNRLFEESPYSFAMLRGPELVVVRANAVTRNIWGRQQEVEGQPLRSILPELESQGWLDLLTEVFHTGVPYHATEAAITIHREGRRQEAFYNFVAQPYRDAADRIIGVLLFGNEVTTQALANSRISASETSVRNLFLQAHVGIAIYGGPGMIIELVNDSMLQYWGRTAEEAIGRPLWEVLPEAREQGFEAIANEVLRTGRSYLSPETAVTFQGSGEQRTLYISFGFEPRRDERGNITGLLSIANDVTAQVLARRKTEESEQRLRSVIDSTPFPIGVYTGPEMRIAYANKNIMDVWGKGYEVIGRNYADVLPELATQHIFEQLAGVYSTGIPFHNRNQRLELEVDGVMTTFYFNYSFTPLYAADGEIYGVLNTAADVTDSNQARQQLLETKAALQDAIELAELATWTIDIPSRSLFYSARLREWCGFGPDEPLTLESAAAVIRPEDLSKINESLLAAIDPAQQRHYDAEYSLVNKMTGREHIVHAQGRAFFDEQGAPVTITGTAQDVTAQRRTQQALERLVQQRTEELAASNEELRTTNEELGEANELLTHSNEELAQYAYVASHDLQEPLRKIRLFSGMLNSKVGLPPKDSELVAKIMQSAERMHLLIRDLLDFSRLLKSDELMKPVDLGMVMHAVAEDFELTVKEKDAQVVIGDLPVIEAVSLQMNQLFYNLLGNALKFTAPGRRPVISIQSAAIPSGEAATYLLRPQPDCGYFRITISDNGIGFAPHYAEQIFEVFKRLHGRDIYPGSGIGLALCRRIAANHKGHLYVESTEGEGSSFHIILPERQPAKPEPEAAE